MVVFQHVLSPSFSVVDSYDIYDPYGLGSHVEINILLLRKEIGDGGWDSSRYFN
jgi:hypothetical protein